MTETDRANDPLRGINVDAAGGASKVLRMVAERVSPVDIVFHRHSRHR